MDTEKNVKKVAVVGAGLVGALEACLLAKKGFEVDVYDIRGDIRNMEHVAGRSINLAMSVRALQALKLLDLDEHIKKEYGIPMYARMIHNKDGSKMSQPYGKKNQCIYSVGRRYINEILLNKGDEFPNIKYHFDHKLISANLDKPELNFNVVGSNEQISVSPDLVIGCDGAYSAVRKEMMKKPRFNYSQEYIPHAYMELSVAPTASNDYAMETNYLHIWPRGKFMMIALPNQDKSFTLTLFMPTDTFNSITDQADLLNFFNENFRDSIDLIGKEILCKDYFTRKALPLVSIKCNPYNIGSTSVIMGDAAHAMVPFYGQGMNCGMEDCLVMDNCLNSETNIESALKKYTELRNPDAEAMCDLALYNYVEMRDLVNKKSFLIRKQLDNLLHWLFPSSWVPLYTSVTFSRMRYHQCITNRKWQDTMLTNITYGLIFLVSAIFLAKFSNII